MKSRILITPLVAVALSCAFLIVSAQQSDDEVRGAFISSRPRTTNANAPVRRHRPPPRNTNSSSGTARNSNSRGNDNTANANTSVANKNSTKTPSQPIALGYTMFMRDVNGRAVRIDPTREFHNGDRIRISLEPNVDGYLYVFHTEGDGQPEMIYPDARLDDGENWIEAHVPTEVPSSGQSDERFHWFVFDNHPATERLYVVLTREPLPSVPTGADLVKFCSENKERCPWRPFSEVWARLQGASKAEVKVVTSKTFGQSETEKEKVAT